MAIGTPAGVFRGFEGLKNPRMRGYPPAFEYVFALPLSAVQTNCWFIAKLLRQYPGSPPHAANMAYTFSKFAGIHGAQQSRFVLAPELASGFELKMAKMEPLPTKMYWSGEQSSCASAAFMLPLTMKLKLSGWPPGTVLNGPEVNWNPYCEQEYPGSVVELESSW